MALAKERYRLKGGDDIGDPRILNARFFDLDLRLHKQEEIEKSWAAALDALQRVGLARIDEVLLPVFNKIRELAQLGTMFTAHSATEIEISSGLKRLTIDEDEREMYAPAAFVAAFVDGDLSKAVLGTVLSYDMASGELELLVDRFEGSGWAANWVIHAASATDNAAAAELAELAKLAALQARDNVISIRDYVDVKHDDVVAYRDAAAASATLATSRADQAQAHLEDVEAVHAQIDAGLAAHSNYHLGALASDPATGPGGVPLVEGVRYFNTSDGAEKTYYNGGFVAAVVPVGSEVTQVFGRTGPVSAQLGDYDATKITFTPAGTIAATTAQAAIEEVATDAASALAALATELATELAGHTHDDRYYTETEMNALLAGKSSTGHNHDGTYLPIAGKAADADKLDGMDATAFAAAGHTHDDRYYTETEMNALLAGKSSTGHNHDGTYLPIAGKAADADKLDGYSSDVSATANTVPLRDGGGGLACSYVGLTHAQASRTGDSIFYSSTDSSVRKNTASGFRTSLNVYSKAEVDAAVAGAGNYSQSGLLALPVTTSVTFAHGLGVVPEKCGAFLRCKVADAGYAVGDHLVLGAGYHYSSVVSISANATSAVVAIWGALYGYATKTGNSNFSPAPANWDVIIWAEA